MPGTTKFYSIFAYVPSELIVIEYAACFCKGFTGTNFAISSAKTRESFIDNPDGTPAVLITRVPQADVMLPSAINTVTELAINDAY